MKFESVTQFDPEAKRLATTALERICELRSGLETPARCAETLKATPDSKCGWRMLHLGLALGLIGADLEARESLQDMRATLDAGPDEQTDCGIWISPALDDFRCSN